MLFTKATLGLLSMLALQSTETHASKRPRYAAPCPSTSNIPIGYVQTYNAYSCRGELQTFSNVSSGVCMDAENFTTARGYRKSSPPDGVECSFNFYGSPGCIGGFVSAGKDTDGSNNWVECVRNFVGVNGDTASNGQSFMYVCYSRKYLNTDRTVYK